MSSIQKEQDDIARNMLVKLGNLQPSRKHIELMRILLFDDIAIKNITFDEKLVKREISCLYLTALGKNSIEIAKILSISPRTVHTYYQKIKSKLKCSSLAHAVYEGIRRGYITQKHHQNNVDFPEKIKSSEKLDDQ